MNVGGYFFRLFFKRKRPSSFKMYLTKHLAPRKRICNLKDSNIEEQKHNTIEKHLRDEHKLRPMDDIYDQFSILKKCQGKLEQYLFLI